MNISSNAYQNKKHIHKTKLNFLYNLYTSVAFLHNINILTYFQLLCKVLLIWHVSVISLTLIKPSASTNGVRFFFPIDGWPLSFWQDNIITSPICRNLVRHLTWKKINCINYTYILKKSVVVSGNIQITNS